MANCDGERDHKLRLRREIEDLVMKMDSFHQTQRDGVFGGGPEGEKGRERDWVLQFISGKNTPSWKNKLYLNIFFFFGQTIIIL